MWVLPGVIVMIAAGLYVAVRRQRFLRLRWPASQGYPQMLQRIGQYMARKGWDVPEFHGATLDAIVIRRNKSGDCIVKGCFLMPDTRRLALENMEAVATFRSRPHTRLLVAAQEITAELILEGRRRNVFIIYYKSLDEIARLDPVSREEFQARLKRIGEAYLNDEQRLRAAAADADVTRSDKIGQAPRPQETAQSSLPAAHPDGGGLLAAGSAALRRRDADEAACIFREVQARDANHVGAASGLAAALGQLGQIDAAREAARHAVALRPRDAALRTQYGQLLNRCADWAAAEVELRAALEEDPSRVGALMGLSIALEQQGRPADAALFLSRAVELSPNQAGPNAQLGHLLLRQRAYPQAEAAFRSALAAEPSHLGAVGGLVTTLKTQGRLKHAIEIIRAAGPDATGDAELLLRLAALLEDDRQSWEASAVFREVLQMKPGHARAEDGLKRTLARCKAA